MVLNSKSMQWLKRWEQNPRIAWILSILWLLLIGWLAFLWNAGSIGLVDETEPLFAEASRQMIVTGDWLTPYFDGVTRFDKPPLIYWCQAIAYYIIGVNEWAVRLPSGLSACALTGLVFYTLRYFGFPSANVVQQQEEIDFGESNRTHIERQLWLSAWLGASLMALNPITIVWARTGVSDILLTACMGGALLAFFLGYAADKIAVKERWYWTFYVLIALAILTKGPVAIVLPGLIIGVFLLYLGNAREVLPEMHLLKGGLIMVAIALPWYVLVTWKNGEDFINSFFIHHNVERFTSVIDRQDGPWYSYFPIVLLGFAPWSIYLPVAIARLRFWEPGKWRSQPRSRHLGLFALFWFALVFVFFSIAVTKRPNYVVPLIPAAAILVALLYSSKFSVKSSEFVNVNSNSGKNSTLFLLSGIFNIVFVVALAVGSFYSAKLMGNDPDLPNIRELLEQSGLPTLGGIIWAVTAIALVLLALQGRWRWQWSANLVGFLAFLIFVAMPASFVMDEVRQLPLRQLSAIVTQVQTPGEELIMIGFEKPSIVFYTRRQVKYIGDTQEAVKYIETRATTKLNSPTVLILSYREILHDSKLQPNQYQNLGEAGAYQLIRISKKVFAS